VPRITRTFYMPITIVYGADTRRTFSYAVYLVGVILLWISPSANWIVYGVMNAQYARAYRFTLCRGAARGGINGSGRPQLTWPPPASGGLSDGLGGVSSAAAAASATIASDESLSAVMIAVCQTAGVSFIVAARIARRAVCRESGG